MTTRIERSLVYETVFEFMADYCINALPTPLDLACRALDIDLVCLTQLKARGMHEEDLFALWGNQDGSVSVSVDHIHGRTTARIYYNDYAPQERQRFTIAEEITHYLLGHYVDERCNVLSPEFDQEFYRHCDEQARIGAGLILCPPAVFYEVPEYNNPADVARLCNISLPCATARVEIMQQYREEILANSLYRRLRLTFDDTISKLMAQTFQGGSLFAF